MKFILTTIICFTVLAANAQEKGINFQNKLTWAQVKEKAKKENKYIFVDCYTTSCVPCKVMAKDVFTQPEVAGFFNDKFVSLALQFDETKKDDADTKSWRAEVKRIEKEYKVNAYPTYLFFTPDGSIVHRIVGGSDAKTFLSKTKEALDPKTQLVNLKKQYAKGDRSPEFLLVFIQALGRSWDPKTREVINVYLPTQKNLLTKENLMLIYQGTKKSTDPGFKVIRQHSKEFDAVNGLGVSSTVICNIAFDELVLPMVRVNGKKVDSGGMYFYTGDINKNVDWGAVKAKLVAKYPDMADEILAKSKLIYLRDKADWPKYTETAIAYATKYGDMKHADDINNCANYIFLAADDKKSLEGAVGLTKQAIALNGPNKEWYQITYANLLYKMGQKEEALTVTNEGIKRLGDRAYGLKELQEKINKNEKSW